MKNILCFICLILSVHNVYAQKEKTVSVKAVTGEFAVILEYADITGREAMQKAREDAKRKALEKVCGSRVSIWDQIETSSAGDVYNSLSINKIDGEIVEFDVLDEGVKQSSVRSVETIFYCTANVKVKRGIAPDPDFSVAVNGLKSVYYAGETLLFNIIPHRNCYMKLFLMEDENKGYLLYPNSYDKAYEIQKGAKFDIADSSYYEFVLQKSIKSFKEINRLVFVFTKTERPFNAQTTSRADIEKWIAKIPNDEKYLHCAVIEIRDK